METSALGVLAFIILSGGIAQAQDAAPADKHQLVTFLWRGTSETRSVLGKN